MKTYFLIKQKINILSVFIFDRTNLDNCLLKSTYPEIRFYKRERVVGKRPSRRRKGSSGPGVGRRTGDSRRGSMKQHLVYMDGKVINPLLWVINIH